MTNLSSGRGNYDRRKGQNLVTLQLTEKRSGQNTGSRNVGQIRFTLTVTVVSFWKHEHDLWQSSILMSTKSNFSHFIPNPYFSIYLTNSIEDSKSLPNLKCCHIRMTCKPDTFMFVIILASTGADYSTCYLQRSKAEFCSIMLLH